MTATVTHPESQQEMPVPDGHVGIPISSELARLALIAADGFKKLSGAELIKLDAQMKASIQMSKPTAKAVGNLMRILGFMFVMNLDEAREKRVQQTTTKEDVHVA